MYLEVHLASTELELSRSQHEFVYRHGEVRLQQHATDIQTTVLVDNSTACHHRVCTGLSSAAISKFACMSWYSQLCCRPATLCLLNPACHMTA